MSKFLHAYTSAYADNLPVCCVFSTILSEPLRNNPFSLSEELKKENKKPQVIRYLDLTNQEALSGFSQSVQCSIPPASTQCMNNSDDSTKTKFHTRYGRGFWGCLIFLSCYGE